MATPRLLGGPTGSWYGDYQQPFTFGLFGEEKPEYGYAQYLNMFGQSDPMRDWMSRNYGQTRQDYLGQYMSALSGGQETPSWLSFLQNYDPYKAYSYASPRDRGENPGAYGGRTRTIF